jgi:hypothetical protein
MKLRYIQLKNVTATSVSVLSSAAVAHVFPSLLLATQETLGIVLGSIQFSFNDVGSIYPYSFALTDFTYHLNWVIGR